MITTTIYHARNVLHICFTDDVGPKHFRELERQLPAVFRCLRPDYSLLLDLSEVTEIDFACGNAITDLMESIVEAGVSKVVYVVPRSAQDSGLAIAKAFHIPASVPFLMYANHEEAEKYLGIEQSVSMVKSRSECFTLLTMQKTALVI